MRDVDVPSPSPPTKFGNYKLLRPIARGRCCVTYEAKQQPPIRYPPIQPTDDVDSVALKIFLPNQDYGGALCREIFVLSVLPEGPYIVKHLGQVLCEGWTGLVQELLSGTIRETLSMLTNKPSPWLLYTIAIDSAKAINELHRFGVIHGDVSLDNMMWNSNSATFLIIDFGLSVKKGENFSHKVYSFECSAPEVHLWKNYLDNPVDTVDTSTFKPTIASDIWALGCLVAKALLGKRLFAEGNPPNYQCEVDRIIEESINELRGHYSDLFLDKMKIFINGCLQVNKEFRKKANELFQPWDIPDIEKPSHDELMILPCFIIRVLNVTDVKEDISKEYLKELRQIFEAHGQLKNRVFDKINGSLYFNYSKSIDAESAFMDLQNTTWRDRTLLITFATPSMLVDAQMKNKNYIAIFSA